MPLPKSLIFVASLSASACTFASSFCAANHDLEKSSCICDEELPALSVPSPSGLTAYAVCDIDSITRNQLKAKHTLPKQIDSGNFYYQGSKILSGTVTKFEDGPNGVVVRLRASRPIASQEQHAPKSRLEKFVVLEEILLVGSKSERLLGTSRLPVKSEGEGWCATATLKITRLQIYVADTEGEGPLSDDFEVVHLGKFRKC